MADIKLMTWNIEHMHNWFNDASTNVLDNFDGVAIKVAGVINDINPDILCVQEGPEHKNQMVGFLNDYVNGSWNVEQGLTGSNSKIARTQKCYIIYKDFTKLQSVNRIDIDIDEWKYDFLTYGEKSGLYSKSKKTFTKIPLELIFNTSSGSFSLICLHIKAKFSVYAHNITSKDKKKKSQAIATGLEQRARMLQEAKVMREYIWEHPFADEIGGRIIIVGDMNDGPGRDFFEDRFFGVDIVKRLRGEVTRPKLILKDPLADISSDDSFSYITYDKIDKRISKPLLDHCLVSPKFTSGNLKVKTNTASIEHDTYMNYNEADWSKKSKPNREKYPSDHRPATIQIKL